MKKNTLLYILIAFLVVMNGFFMVKIFGDKPPKRSNPGNFIAKELQFDAAQLEKFSVMNDDHHEEMMQLSREIKELKDELFEYISETTIDTAKVNNITKRIGALEQQKDSATFYHFKEVQKICTPEQREQFNMLVKKALKPRGRRGPR